MLACPACHALVHRARLEGLSRDAERARAAKDFVTAANLWREALSLLPSGSLQYDAVALQVDAMTAAIEGKTADEVRQGPPAGSRWAKILGPLGIAGLLLWKFKFILVAVFSKGKLLLVGLTKMGTIATLFVSLGVYWAAWGWKFAAAIIGGIYIHEIGHVAELRRRGMNASAPMFVPGLGAFVRLKQHAATPSEDARIGLAGPIWGLGAALVAFGVGLATDSKFWLAIAHFTAVINLFNLIPVWELDGSRGLRALTRMQRGVLLVVIIATWIATRSEMLILVAIVVVWRLFEKKITTTHDWGAFATFVILIAALGALSFFAR
jgi:Zn-dependent protease